MDTVMIERWNSVVKDEDTVYHLGDFHWLGFIEAESIFNQLNGNIYLIKGNHDEWLDAEYYLPNTKTSSVYLRDAEFELSVSNNRSIVLSHYSMRTWNNRKHGWMHLYGHSHGTLEPLGRSFDIGVDCWNFTPVSLEQVLEKMNRLPIW